MIRLVSIGKGVNNVWEYLRIHLAIGRVLCSFDYYILRKGTMGKVIGDFCLFAIERESDLNDLLFYDSS